jgi:hypothetical protein
LSDGEYEVLKSPTDTKMEGHVDLYLGKSEKGVYCALTCSWQKRIHVWLLTESCGKLEWILKNDIGLVPMFENISGNFQDEHSASWMLHKGSYDEDAKETHVEDKLEWNFENGIILEAGHKTEWDYRSEVIHFLGFHPCKEVVFLWLAEKRVVAYHLSSSKVQYLGNLRLHCLGYSFPYTPCWTGELVGQN